MNGGSGSEPERAPADSADVAGRRPPRPSLAWLVAGLSALAVALSAWLALRPGAESAQSDIVRWLNDPPQPLAALLAVTNPVLRPVPLTVVAVLLAGWVLLTADGTKERLEAVRALVVGLVLAEGLAQALKRVVDQPRPLAVIAGLDTHGYPGVPRGSAYPSAHTALVVAAVCALWPWMRWPQRVVGLVLAVLVAANRVYVGAHWPVDVLGGVAVGLLCGAVTWLVAARWPIRR